MSLLTFFLLIHISGATFGLLSGFMAMALRKGSGWHGAAGSIFFISMLCMTASGAYISAFLRPNRLNLVVSFLTAYLVLTAWRAAKRRELVTDRFDVGGMVFVFVVAIMAFAAGFERKHGMPVPAYFIFGTIALLCAKTDLRMLRQRGVAGTQRLVRHLWRMSLALLIATLSFYPGQAKLFPRWLRDTNVLMLPHLLLIGAMVFWMWKMRRRRDLSAAAQPHEVSAAARRATAAEGLRVATIGGGGGS